MKRLYLEIFIAGEAFYLLPQKAVYRPAKKQLILSDIHLGKSTHFRKKGLSMPVQSHLRDIDTLHFLLDLWKPETLLVLGDLFHSSYNREWLWLKSLMLQYPQVKFILVEGNHDILNEEAYDLPNLTKAALLEDEHFIFSHHPLNSAPKLNFCGHIHPGFKLQGIAKQAEKLPCFFQNKTHFILPAFGHLTGLRILEEEKNACYYLVAGTRIIKYG